MVNSGQGISINLPVPTIPGTFVPATTKEYTLIDSIKAKTNPSDIEVIGVKATPRFVQRTVAGGTHYTNALTLQTQYYTAGDWFTMDANRVRLKTVNNSGVAQWLTDAAIRGKVVYRLSGAQGWIHDKFVNYDDILRNGESTLKIQNNMICNLTQINQLADYWWKVNKNKKHIYQITLSGTRHWYKLGSWYTLQIGGAGEVEYIDSTVRLIKKTVEQSAETMGRTVLTFMEVEENWKFDSTEIARYISNGIPLRTLNGGNVLTVASSDYTGLADYYCDGTADQTEIQAAIDALVDSFGGGVVHLTRGTFNITDTLTLYSNIVLEGEGKETVISSTGSGDIIALDDDAENVMVQNLKVVNAETGYYSKFALKMSGGTACAVLNNNFDFTKGQGIDCDGNKNAIINNTFQGGVDTDFIDPGSEYVFNSVSTYYISVSALTDTSFVVAYRDVGNSNYGTAIIGVVTGDNEISYGSEYVFNSALTSYISVSALTDTSFVVAWRDDGNSGYGTAIIGVVSSANVITYGSEYVFNSAETYYISVSALTDTSFVVAYRDEGNSGYGTAIIGVVSSANVITYGSEYVFNSVSTYYISVSALTDTSFVVAYRDDGNSNYGTAIIGVVSSANVITYGSEYVFNSATTYYISVSALTDTSFVVAYRDVGNSNYGTAIIGVVSSANVITYGSEYVFNSATTNYISVSALTDTSFVVAYRDDGNSNYGTAIIGVVLGTHIQYSSEYVVVSSATVYISSSKLGDSAVIAYENFGDSTGAAKVLSLTSYPNAITVSGDNNIVQANTIQGQDSYNIWGGIVTSGDDNIISNNMLNGLDSTTNKNIWYGVVTQTTANRVSINNNKITNCNEIGLLITGTNNHVSNNYCYANGGDTGIANENGDNFTDDGTDTLIG